MILVFSSINMPKNPTSKEDASRIQASQAKNNRDTGKNSFSSRAQSAGDRNTNQSGDNQGGNQGGNQGDNHQQGKQ